jgi:hypothetical protein
MAFQRRVDFADTLVVIVAFTSFSEHSCHAIRRDNETMIPSLLVIPPLYGSMSKLALHNTSVTYVQMRLD